MRRARQCFCPRVSEREPGGCDPVCVPACAPGWERAARVYTRHEGRGRLGRALPAAGRGRAALAAAAPGEVTRPPPGLPLSPPPSRSPAGSPAVFFQAGRGARGPRARPRAHPGSCVRCPRAGRPQLGRAPPARPARGPRRWPDHHVAAAEADRRLLSPVLLRPEGDTGAQIRGPSFFLLFSSPGRLGPATLSLGENPSGAARGEQLPES